MEWKPIETAPKDGTIILISRPNREAMAAYWSQCPRAFAGTFSDANYPWVFLDETNGTNAMMDGAHGPTHWMPLPAPPVQQEG